MRDSDTLGGLDPRRCGRPVDAPGTEAEDRADTATGSAGTILVTGASGYLGARTVAIAAGGAGGPRFDVHAVAHTRPISDEIRDKGVPEHRLDLRERSAVERLLTDTAPRAVLHLAGSDRTPESLASIAPSARHLVGACAGRSIRLVLMSTDMVFDGERAPYREDAPPAPMHPYGEAKAEAEAIAAEAVERGDDVLVVRTSLIFGLAPLDRATTWLVDGARSGKDVGLFRDEIRCPIHVDDLARALVELAVLSRRGVLHVAGPEPLDRFSFDSALLEALGIERPANVRETTIEAAGLKRPRDLTLDCTLARQSLSTRLRGAREALLARPGPA